MTAYRPHRFPPLQAAVPALRADTADAASAAHWQRSVAEGFQQGMERGYREGHASGLADGRAEGVAQGLAEGRAQAAEEARAALAEQLRTLARPVDAMLRALEHLKADYQAAQRKEMVELVERVARQVIRCELTLQPVQLLALVDETLAQLPPAPDGGVEVHLNPGDLERIRQIDPKRFKRWKLVPDARLDAGECRVRAGDHEVDAGCNQRLAACMSQVSAQLLDMGEPAPAAAEEVGA